MTLKGRLRRAHRMTAPLKPAPQMPDIGVTVLTISDVLWEKDETGRPVTRVPDYAVYKELKTAKVVHKNEAGLWIYDDGSPLKVTGLLITVRADVMP